MAKIKGKISIAVCGSAGGKFSKDALERSKKIGFHLAKSEVLVLVPEPLGYPYAAGKAAKEAGAFSLGVSPLANRKEHLRFYKKPLDVWDAVIYTGLGFKTRNVVLMQSADAVIFIGGGTGTLNEFTIAYDQGKPIGILLGVEGTMELVDQIVEKNYKPSPPIIKEENPEKLVKGILREAARYIRETSG